MSKLRYAILGSGMMGHEHIRNIHLLEETEVSAVSDPDEEMREKAVSLTDGRAKAFIDHRDLPWASDPGFGPELHNLQTQMWTSWREPSCNGLPDQQD